MIPSRKASSTAEVYSARPRSRNLKNGWPEKRERCPIQVRDYWNYIEEISLHNAILFKSQRVIIPKAMRPERLSRIHSSHQGIASCLRKAEEIVFWLGTNSEIKAVVERCSVCAEFQAKNAGQPIRSHKVSDRPWKKVATDLFTVNITLVDYFPDFVEVDELEDTTSNRNSVGFRILLFQTMVHRLAVRNFTSFYAAGNSTT